MAVRSAYFRRACALLALGAIAAACGGANDSGLFASGGDNTLPEENQHDAGASDGSVLPPPPDHDSGHREGMADQNDGARREDDFLPDTRDPVGEH